MNIKDILVPLLYVFVPCILILKQPDLGTAVVILLSCLAIFWFVGLTKPTYLFLGVTGLSVIPVLWKFLMKPYQKMRILSLVNPDLDPSGTAIIRYRQRSRSAREGFSGRGT